MALNLTSISFCVRDRNRKLLANETRAFVQMRNKSSISFLTGVACLLSIAVLFDGPHQALAQSCCGSAPTSENTTANGSDPNYPTATDFDMTLKGGSGSFSGWTVAEYSPQQGSDGCYNSKVNPSYVPEYPDPTSTGSSWLVNSANVYGPDIVGWKPTSVTYVRNNSPLHSSTPLIPNFPCGAEVYQALSAACTKSTTPTLYIPNQAQTETINSTTVQNCRPLGTCSTLNH